MTETEFKEKGVLIAKSIAEMSMSGAALRKDSVIEFEDLTAQTEYSNNQEYQATLDFAGNRIHFTNYAGHNIYQPFSSFT